MSLKNSRLDIFWAVCSGNYPEALIRHFYRRPFKDGLKHLQRRHFAAKGSQANDFCHTAITEKTKNPDERWLRENEEAIRTPEELKDFLGLSDDEVSDIKEVCDTFQIKIPRYYLGLIDKDDPKDPIKKMSIPSIKELNFRKGELSDPIGDTNKELRNQPTPLVTHRYPDRALLYPTPFCGGYCRHCFRRRLAGKKDFKPDHKLLEEGLDYLEKTKEIKEVILTGGDPLMLNDEEIFYILERLRKIEHIKTLRIHSRMPVWNPFRITKKLADGLSKFHPLWIVTHFNHPNELTPEAKEHIAKLVDRGIVVMNQSVLLKGVNDSVETQSKLIWELISSRVKPYYLHHLDKAQGISHFRTNIKRGIGILKSLRGTVPGYGIPHYILDIPGGYGKIPLQYHYLNSDEGGNIIVETPEGEFLQYPENVDDKPEEIEHLKELEPIHLYSKEELERIEELKEE